MAQYTLTTWPIHEIGNGSEVSIIDFQPTPRRDIEAANMGDLATAFEAFVTELQDCGKCYRISVRKNPRCKARKFSGFDKATERGGNLCRIINREVAEAAFRANGSQ